MNKEKLQQLLLKFAMAAQANNRSDARSIAREIELLFIETYNNGRMDGKPGSDWE